MDRPTCRVCGAVMLPHSVWCPQCFRRPLSKEGAASLVADVDLLSSPHRWEPPRAQPAPRDTVSTWSRTAAGPTSFGLAGRTVMTSVLVGLFVVGALQLGVSRNGGPFTFLYVGFTAPGSLLLLRAIWKKERNVIPLPMRECRVCKEMFAVGHESCPRCKAAV